MAGFQGSNRLQEHKVGEREARGNASFSGSEKK